MSRRSDSQPLLTFVVAVEAATGLALMAAPSLFTMILLGAALNETATVVARTAGAGLIGLAISCWPNRETGVRLTAPYSGMLVYNVLATLVLAEFATVTAGAGKILWAALIFHVILSGLLALARLGLRTGGRAEVSV